MNMAKTHVDVTTEIFGSATSIAHLARVAFDGEDSQEMTVEYAMRLIHGDWPFEIDHSKTENECGVGIRVTCKDGSVLHVGAWADRHGAFQPKVQTHKMLGVMSGL
jgi:hypothetical protein